jgi:hypothetical protein
MFSFHLIWADNIYVSDITATAKKKVTKFAPNFLLHDISFRYMQTWQYHGVLINISYATVYNFPFQITLAYLQKWIGNKVFIVNKRIWVRLH